jgi:hypothetical protein
VLRKLAIAGAAIWIILAANLWSCGGGSNHGGESIPPQQHAGTRYYVAKDGNDENPGTVSAPWRTIQHAASVVNPSETVIVTPGTYNGPFVTRKSGAADGRIRFISSVRWEAKLQSMGGEAIWQNTGNYVDIIGFDVTGTETHQGIFTAGSHGRILGNHVHDLAIPCDSNGGAGINAGNYAATTNLIDGNTVHDIGVWGTLCNAVHGIYIAQSNDVVSNNIVYRTTGSAINMYHDSATNARIVNNTVFNAGAAGPNGTCYGAGIGIGGAKNDNTIIANNIVRDIHCWAILELDGDNGPNNKFMNNLLYNNARAIYAKTGTISGTITADPQFMNYVPTGGGNYDLASSSPAIGRANSSFTPKTDYVGGNRPTGGAPDLGAYEFDSSPANWPWF